MVSVKDLPSSSSVFSAYASMSASVMLFRTIFHQLIPHQAQQYLLSTLRHYFKTRNSLITLVIDEKDGISRNQIFDSSEIYLCNKLNPNTHRLKISKSAKEKHFTLRFAGSQKIIDSFEGIELTWRFICQDLQKKEDDDSHRFNGKLSEKKYFELTFDKKELNKVLESYLPFLLTKANLIKDEKKVLKLYTLAHSYYSHPLGWDSVNLEHPSTFDKLAMEPRLKKSIIEDLDRFLERKEFYRHVGKAWKRGYLLYGPPGTGKSSLIAAMANYLKFDIYDLQLMNIKSDSDLRKLLLATGNGSILVIEDIDCSVELPDRNVVQADKRPRDLQFSLAGLLNFIDGLWSSCGDERIIIFTTNNKERLDPALLRPGRMDMHIHMSYLTTHGFKLLASNYLGIHDHHRRFGEIEELIENSKVTPAEVAEELMKSSDADVSLGGVVNFLKRKKMEGCENEGEGTRGIELQEAKSLKPKRAKK